MVPGVQAVKQRAWAVDPQAVIEQFKAEPSSVMLLLAATNVLPTLLHWSLGLPGCGPTDGLGPDATNAKARADRVLNGSALGQVDAEEFADYLLFGHRPLSLAFALCLLAWALCALQWLVPRSLSWLL